jgi:serine/threonine-protein kinase RsbW
LARELVISSDFKAAREAERVVLNELARRGFAPSPTFAVRLALEEGLNNAINHGNGCDPSKKVTIAFDVDETRVAITITDQGEGFDPSTVPDPRAEENLEKPSGRGLMLMRAYMDEVRFNERGNQVRMIKRNS